MKTGLNVKRAVGAIATAGLVTFSAISSAIAQTGFGQKEVDQEKYIALAAPFGAGNYQLIVLEQVSNKRQCWSESGTQSPIQVDPLLLKFDFTGICGRSTDSNGYSIRMAGTDYGQKYDFNLIKRDGEVILVGQDLRDRRAPVIKIGSTQGMTDGFMKIILEPGWKFARRTYEGKTLGHVYLASDVVATGIDLSGSGTGTGSGPGTGTGTGTGTTLAFRDITSDVYAKEITDAVAMGFVSGFKEDNTFRPEVALTREQLVSMVLEGLSKLPGTNVNIPAQASSKPYPDVDATRWSAAKIQWARDNKIVSGYKDGKFRPTQPVTRAELMAVQRRAAEFAKSSRGLPSQLTGKNSPTAFSDTSKHWASGLIGEMSSYCNVASPLNERGTNFEPESAARRNYAAAATLRMLNCAKSEQS